MSRPAPCPGAQRGLALAVVLWFLVLLTIMAGSFSVTVRRETQLARSAIDAAQARALADGGVQFALMMLAHPLEPRRWRADRTVYQFPLGVAIVRARISDEAGKFDLNYTSRRVLASVFQYAGASITTATGLADAVLDWRDSDNVRRSHGAEADDYRRARLPYAPSNRGFRSVDELRLVLGMTAALYRQLEPLLTVYSGGSGIDPSVAAPEVLLALPRVNAHQVEQYLAQRSTGEANATLDEYLNFFDNVPGLAAPGNRVLFAYTVQADARLPNGTYASVTATVQKNQGNTGNGPYQTLRWNQSAATESLFQVPAGIPIVTTAP